MQMMTEKAKEVLNNLVNKITTEETLEFMKMKLFSDDVDIPCQKWSFLNQFLVFLAGTYDARGIRQWAKVGRRLIKGCKAFYILVPMIAKMPDNESNEPGKTISKLAGYKAMPVFRTEDTTGEPLNYEIKLHNFDPTSLPLIGVAKKLGVKVEAALTKDYYGSFRLSDNKITMGTDDPQTFLHELSHAIDYHLPNFKRELVINEIVTELSSAFLGSLYGIKIDINNTIAYIQGYNGKANIVNNVMQSLQRVEEIYNYVRKSNKTNNSKIKTNIA
jgi:hypothetical protein